MTSAHSPQRINAIRKEDIIEWRVDASSEWIDQTFGVERVKSFCLEFAQFEYERRMREVVQAEAHTEPSPLSA
jgi:hypothetical protein